MGVDILGINITALPTNQHVNTIDTLGLAFKMCFTANQRMEKEQFPVIYV